eukprot:COSAG01_NODE_1771_length_9270_cov_5.316868_7_plen_138_part_00
MPPPTPPPPTLARAKEDALRIHAAVGDGAVVYGRLLRSSQRRLHAAANVGASGGRRVNRGLGGSGEGLERFSTACNHTVLTSPFDDPPAPVQYCCPPVSLNNNKHPWCGESQFFIHHTKWEAHVRMVSRVIATRPLP